MIKRMGIREIKTVDINGDINEIGPIFLKNRYETVFVIDSEQHLYGIITAGDFFRKIASSKNIFELMNKKYISIDYNSDNHFEIANEIFKNNIKIRTIPIVDNDKIIYLLFNNEYNNEYNFKTIEQTLMLRKCGERLAEFLKAGNIKTIAVIQEDELISFASDILEKFALVERVKSEQELEESQNKNFDMVLKHKNISTSTMKLKLKGVIVINLPLFLDFFYKSKDLIENQIPDLKKITDKIAFFMIPNIFNIKNMSCSELGLMDKKISKQIISLGLDMSEEEKKIYEDKCARSPHFIMRNGEICIDNLESQYINIINGRRVVTDDRGDYKNRIFVLGNSLAYGFGSEDKYTIQSFMQKIINDTKQEYRVVNCGIARHFSIYNILEEAQEGDKIVVILGYNYKEWLWMLKMLENHINNFSQIYCLKHLFDRPHDMGEVYFDRGHINHIGNKRVAEEIIKIMDKNPQEGLVSRSGIEALNQKEPDFDLMEKGLRDFLDDISKHKFETGNVGAIVMNCNPFTNGHRYLIEYAAISCEFLFVFVVQEDKSYFKFEDRLALVKQGTADLPNVTVLPGGGYIISSITFEEYFYKDKLQETTINPSLDIEIFGKHIAPALNIKKRFAGEEPIDHITKQYNDTMKKTLPRYGIEFVEIPRKESGGQPISASMVRNLIEKKDFEGIKDIVPMTTFEFIKLHYK
ncbi:MAG: CBS domain-containing protein [Oscillospiraceae bacterium]|nr:CBS domain-containing protein [Oscillospiraceae bacterium]